MTTVANSREQIINGATINGVVNIANGGILGLNSASTSGGIQTLAGNVSINLNDANARLSIDGIGSTTLGTAIWSMHFIGMLALKLPIPLSYDLSLTLLSVVPAIAAAFVGLLSLFNIGGRVFWASLSDKIGRRKLMMAPFHHGTATRCSSSPEARRIGR